MDELADIQKDWGKRERLLERLDMMVASGRLTGPEAKRLRAAAGPGAFGLVIRDIRVRHAGAALDAAVRDGDMSREEVDGLLEKMRMGDHSLSLRSEISSIRARGRQQAHEPEVKP